MLYIYEKCSKPKLPLHTKILSLSLFNIFTTLLYYYIYLTVQNTPSFY